MRDLKTKLPRCPTKQGEPRLALFFFITSTAISPGRRGGPSHSVARDHVVGVKAILTNSGPAILTNSNLLVLSSLCIIECHDVAASDLRSERLCERRRRAGSCQGSQCKRDWKVFHVTSPFDDYRPEVGAQVRRSLLLRH
jgi:hypothetical protein